MLALVKFNAIYEKMNKVILILIFSEILQLSNCIIAYESLDSVVVPKSSAGLKLLANTTLQQTSFEQGISICARFNYSQLLHSESWVYYFGKHDWSNHAGFSTGYHGTFLTFWNINWIVKDLNPESFQIWTANRWHHTCFSFDRNLSSVKFVKVKNN